MFDIVTFGSATRDLFLKSKDFKTLKSKKFITGQGLCFNLGSKIYLDDLFLATGGGGTNAAVTFAGQGLKTACVGRVGNDPGGKAILEELEKFKIRGLISEDKKIKTAYSIVLSVSRKERTILVYSGACHYLTLEDIPFNQEEGAKLAGLPFEKEKEIFRKLDKYVKGIVVMTKGPKGVVVSDGKYIYSAGTYKERRYIDRTGAGDAFGSGFVSGLVKVGQPKAGRPWAEKIEEAIRLGSANGTAGVEELGAKNGLLTKNRYEKEARWKKFKITKNKL